MNRTHKNKVHKYYKATENRSKDKQYMRWICVCVFTKTQYEQEWTKKRSFFFRCSFDILLLPSLESSIHFHLVSRTQQHIRMWVCIISWLRITHAPFNLLFLFCSFTHSLTHSSRRQFADPEVHKHFTIVFFFPSNLLLLSWLDNRASECVLWACVRTRSFACTFIRNSKYSMIYMGPLVMLCIASSNENESLAESWLAAIESNCFKTKRRCKQHQNGIFVAVHLL